MGPSRRCCCGIALLATLAWLAACANVRPLEGGPPDVTPPHLVSSAPAESSVALGVTPVLELRFSESLNASSVRSGLRTYPSLPRPELRVKGSHVQVRYVEPLPPDTTLVIVLGRDIQDAPGRDNPLPAEVWLVYATGDSLRAGAILGRVAVKGKPEAQAAVRFEPLGADSAAAAPSRGPRPRLPAAATDAEGLFQLRGLPVHRPFQLRAFVDRNGNLEPDEGELQSAPAETLRLAPGQVMRGLQWNLVDPKEPGLVTGVVFNSSAVAGPIAVMLVALDAPAAAAAAPPDSAAPAAPGAARPDASAADSLVPAPDSLPAPPVGERRDSQEPAPDARRARADTLRSDLPVAPQGPWAPAYAALALPDSAPLRRVVYASPRGDYSVRVRPGRHRLLAFVDVSGDSLPGTAIAPDSTRRDWEPLWVGGVVEVAPGAEVRPRAIDIQAPR